MRELLLYLPEVSLVVVTLIVSIILIRWQVGPTKFDLSDTLIGPDGKVSLFKVGQAVALVISSWAFVILVQRDKLTEYYFYGYMAIWSGINLIKNIAGKKPDDSTNQT